MNALVTLLAAATLAGVGPAPDPTPVGHPFCTLAIVTPVSQQTIFRDTGDVTIQFAVTPGLSEGDRILVQADDQVTLLPAGTTRHVITGVTHGTHVLYAVIVNAEGDTVAVSQTIFFHMGEPTIRTFLDWVRA